MRSFCLLIVLLSAAMVIFSGCGGDSSSPKPVTGVSLSPDEMDIELGHSREITPTVNGDNKNLTWYVNDIENGNELVGEITENSPVTYTAPNWLPNPSAVLIKAVSDEDTTLYDSCAVNITFEKLFVDPEDGSDGSGANGCVNLPYKSITKAITQVSPGMTVVAQPGTYTADTGEDFPIICHTDSVTIEGTDWEECRIQGHDEVGTYGLIVTVGRTGQAFRKFTLEQGLPADDCSIMLYVSGNDAHIDSIRVGERSNYSVARVYGAVRPLIENCQFIVNDGNPDQRGITMYPTSDGAIIRNCTVIGYDVGLRIMNSSNALVEGCTFEGNEFGAEAKSEAPPGSLSPDFGGGARGSTGGNIFNNNVYCGLRIELDHPVYAKYNTWTNDPPEPDVDFCVVGDGGVIFED